MNDKLPSFFKRANKWVKKSVTIRLITISVLLMLLLIPVGMVKDLIRDLCNKYFQKPEADQKYRLV